MHAPDRDGLSLILDRHELNFQPNHHAVSERMCLLESVKKHIFHHRLPFKKLCLVVFASSSLLFFLTFCVFLCFIREAAGASRNGHTAYLDMDGIMTWMTNGVEMGQVGRLWCGNVLNQLIHLFLVFLSFFLFFSFFHATLTGCFMSGRRPFYHSRYCHRYIVYAASEIKSVKIMVFAPCIISVHNERVRSGQDLAVKA